MTGITTEDREAQLKYIRELTATFFAEGAVETELARNIALDYWRVDRLKALEQTIPPASPILEKIALNASRLNRSIHRNINLLSKLQSTRSDRSSKPRRLAPVIEITSRRPL
jgi:hypothetical protein